MYSLCLITREIYPLLFSYFCNITSQDRTDNPFLIYCDILNKLFYISNDKLILTNTFSLILQKQHVLKKKGADLQKIQATGVKRNKTGKKTLKHEGPQAQATDLGIVSSPLITNMKKNSLQNSFQEKKQHVLKKKGADLQKIQATGVKRNKTGKKTLKHEGPQAQATDLGIVSSPLITNMKKNSLQNSFQEKKQHVLKKKGADLQKIQATGVKRNKTGKKTLKHEGPQAQATDLGIVSSPLITNMKKNSLQNSFQEKWLGPGTRLSWTLLGAEEERKPHS
ncbi:uncharacterized protein LOC135272024 isoform X3 [Aotus nancymaae]|uniref:uncharacterized protein LOC135272024 isoform X3 n=1 Tax=Aotus nancymaae TaxID=37293 RepID=UPI0030FEB8F9